MLIRIIDANECGELNAWARLIGLNKALVAHDVAIYFGEFAKESFEKNEAWLRSKGYIRLFESCYLPEQSTQSRHELTHSLFEWISKSYENEINSTTNIGCYDTLFNELRSREDIELRRVLDFGCGPGTVLSSNFSGVIPTLVGFDFVEENRIKALQRGLQMLDLSSQVSPNISKFDAVVSVYVLHYQSLSYEEIEIVADCLRMGGIWAANFHKSQGIAWFKKSLLKISNNSWSFDLLPSPFGELVFARKIN